MRPSLTMSAFFVLALPFASVSAQLVDTVCENIKQAISASSAVFYPGTSEYTKGVFHWASSSSEHANCVVQPGTAPDVGIILGILGQTKTKFGVKGGGHASNPGFSSTTGVQIYMGRFSSVVYDAASQTAEIGAGLLWDDVYAALEPHGVSVVGGRVTGVGVAGFTLGGGYSWKSNQYGLTVDTITSYELVKPDGSVVTVTESSDEDLFFGLKGGFNNFGIVTKFTLKTFPQGQVWGGSIVIPGTKFADVSAATADFASKVTDPKAGIITTYNALLGVPLVSLLLFYDAPTPPSGIFDSFLAIPATTKDVKTRSLISLVQSSPANATAGTRARFNSVSLQAITPKILEIIENEVTFWSTHLTLDSATFISYDVEPFLPSVYTSSSSASAFPPTRSSTILPLNLYFAWALPSSDDTFQDSIKRSAATIASEALNDGQSAVASNAVYPNYAIYDTPLENIYGQNLPRLKSIKARVDPDNVMGLAGGFKF